jgi:poly(hydroxyalkanoate) depolymerase family esterase
MAADNLQEIENFGTNPGNLEMFIYIPSNLPDTLKKIPLVLALHGCSQKAENIAKRSEWNQLADKHHFIVLYPQQKRINNPSNCFNWFNLDDIEMGMGESASIKSMIDFALDSFAIDTENVFVYGLSAGAQMSVTLMVNYPSTFKAGAIFAGGPYKIATNGMQALKVMVNPPDKTPQEWGRLINQKTNECIPRMIVVHGTRDKVVNIQNSMELIDQWTFLQQTDNLPDSSISNFNSNPLIKRYSYRDSTDREVVVFYEISKTGHALPVDPGEGEEQGGTIGTYAVDRNFYSTYYIAKEFELIK